MPYLTDLSPDLQVQNNQLLRAIARQLGLLPPLPEGGGGGIGVATVTTSIGTSSRDYSTITAWEADLDSGIYSSGDHAVGECYDDSAFDEAVTVNGGGTVGLASITLTVAAGERHDGTAGTGARLVASTGRTLIKNTGMTGRAYHVDWLEWNCNGQAVASAIRSNAGGTANTVNRWSRMLVHDNPGASNTPPGFAADFGTLQVDVLENCIFYDLDYPDNVLNEVIDLTGNTHAYNLTVHNGASGATTQNYRGILAGRDVRNCAVTNITEAGSGTSECFSGSPSGTESHNASDDATAAGTGSITGISSGDEYVSTVHGSEDLHLKAGADCIDAGTDLGTTPTGVNIDINGYDRDAGGVTWDIGAHEFISGGGTILPFMMQLEHGGA